MRREGLHAADGLPGGRAQRGAAIVVVVAAAAAAAAAVTRPSRPDSAHAPTSQGLFNPLNRMVEDELLPVLRANNIQFIAYNPLAAGLLSGKHRNTDGVLEGRFKSTASCLDGGNAALASRPRTWIQIHHPP